MISCAGDDSSNLSCNEEVCCDEFGCSPIDQGGAGQGNGAQGGGGGASAGGAGQGGAGGAAAVCDPAINQCPCANDGTCAEGLSCIAGDCVEPCLFDYECTDGQVCADGLCSVSCSDQIPCLTGYACIGGACLIDAANPQCQDDTTCDGLVCAGGICRPACVTNADCGAGTVCQASSGACVPDTSPTTACSAELACPGVGQFCDDSGYCRYACATLEECKLIDARFDGCDAGVCKTQEEISPQCSFESPCLEGAVCVSNVCVL